MTIDLSDVAGLNEHETRFLYDEIFVRRGYDFPRLHLPDEPVIFDIGANIGMFTLYAHVLRPLATVFAFEPVPDVFDVLRRNVRRHGVRAHLFPCGLADSEREEEFTHYPGYSTMSTRRSLADTEAERQFVKGQVADQQEAEARQMLDELLAYRFRERAVRCRLRTLSSVLDEHRPTRVDLLKIDVQRGERDVLAGLEDRHWPLVRNLVMEVHDDPGTPSEGCLSEVTGELRGRGFDVLTGQEERYAGTDRHHLFAVRT